MQTQITFPVKKKSTKNFITKENIPIIKNVIPDQFQKHLIDNDANYNYSVILQKNKYAFTSSNRNIDIVGREKEINGIKSYIFSHLQCKQSGILYISGPPGTGKTFSINKILEDLPKKNLKQTFINCLSFSKSEDVYTKIITWLLQSRAKSKISKGYTYNFNSTKNSGMRLIVLDEIDNIRLKNDDTLIKIFQLASHIKSNIILIGISNTLNMIEAMQPKFGKLLILPPNIIEYIPYQTSEIMSILENRMLQAGLKENEILFEHSALEICCKKVASLTGDIRIALDACRKSLDYLELDSSQIFREFTNAQSQKNNNKVSILTICNVLPNQANEFNYLATLSLNQKIIIATILHLVKKNGLKCVLINKAYENYVANCKIHKFNSISFQDFLTSCELLEDQRYIKILNNNQCFLKKIHLNLEVTDIETMIQDQGILSNIMYNL